MIPHTVEPERLFAPDELAGWLGVPVKTLAEWRSRGDGGPKYLKVGRHIRYRQSDVESWLVERERGRPTAS